MVVTPCLVVEDLLAVIPGSRVGVATDILVLVPKRAEIIRAVFCCLAARWDALLHWRWSLRHNENLTTHGNADVYNRTSLLMVSSTRPFSLQRDITGRKIPTTSILVRKDNPTTSSLSIPHDIILKTTPHHRHLFTTWHHPIGNSTTLNLCLRHDIIVSITRQHPAFVYDMSMSVRIAQQGQLLFTAWHHCL